MTTARTATDEAPAAQAAARTPSSSERSIQVIDWDLAARIAGRVSGTDPFARSYHAALLEPEFHRATEQAEGLVIELTGLRPLTGITNGVVVDRAEWARANLRSFERLFEPLSHRVAERLARPEAIAARVVLPRVAGAEIGGLLGLLAQRVLGQYDLVGGGESDLVSYVGPNVLSLEKRFGFRPADFRLWIALHEVTHRVQFSGVPWMRAYFDDLVRQSMSLADPDPKRMVRIIERTAKHVRQRTNPFAEGLVGLFASPEQQRVLDRAQALMSLLEGHGNVVMDRLGAQHVAGQARMSRVLRDRRETKGARNLVFKLLGFEMKMKQYEIGERFIYRVEQLAGFSAIDTCWQRPENVPTLVELERPETWLERVGLGSPSGRSRDGI